MFNSREKQEKIRLRENLECNLEPCQVEAAKTNKHATIHATY